MLFDQAQFRINGDLFKLPWVDESVGWAAVLEAAHNGFLLSPDPRSADPSTFQNPFGAYLTGGGTRQRFSLGTEFRVPILDSLTWTISGRGDKYNDASMVDVAKTSVKVTLPDGSKYDQDGALDFSGATVDPTTGSVNLRALLANPQRRLLPGTYVTITANLGELHNVFLVPQAAVQRDVVGAYALVVGQDGNVVRKNVSAENQAGPNWIVTKGLSNGDQVIVSGLQTVQPGKPAKAARHPSPDVV